ncbi:MAG: hypothetical protein EA383_16375 [Spirochaetaceae bacterium]|nr:MAG: hypothetical protein EA383_16375 [Spirochaetaceae bacterium]
MLNRSDDASPYRALEHTGEAGIMTDSSPRTEAPVQIPAFDRSPEFDPKRFASPPAIDRGAPLWSLNGELEVGRLRDQFAVFAEMGLGGLHLHPRTGLTTRYMGDEFLAGIRASVDEAEQRGMHAWLYDEDRWPSGFAGGLATADEGNRLRHLRLSRVRINSGETLPCPTHHGNPLPLATRSFVAAWELTFAEGLLIERRRIAEDEPVAQGRAALYAYLEIPPAWTWFNNTQYVDTLNTTAMRRFIEETHERYYATVGDRFGTVVPAIFTDEPLFRGMDLPQASDDTRDRFLSWTDDLPESYAAEYGEDLLDVLPDVFYDRADGLHCRARWRFHNHHTDRFVAAFAGQLGAWCADHGIALTGHMMAEATLGNQTEWTGETMRSLRHFQLPGIDMLCDSLELTTAKQAQSVARQTGAPGTMSELYGVSNWDFPFEGHKRQGDWQAALGVVLRVHHLTWYQMGGEAKRDYPASIGTHSPWWKRYHLVEDHFARLHAALRSGNPRCRVGMIHPVESYWLVHGPTASFRERQRLEDGFAATLRWMIEDLIDVDLVSEAVLEDLSRDENAGEIQTDGEGHPVFAVGTMSYDAIVVPPVLTMRRTTLERLQRFAAAGGTVFLVDGGPDLIDAETPVRPEDVEGFDAIAWQRSELLAKLEPLRDIRLLTSRQVAASGIVHQQRELPDGGRIVFVARFNDDPNYDLSGAALEIRGSWDVQLLDTAMGTESPHPATTRGGWTSVPLDLPVAGHILLRLLPGAPALAPREIAPQVETGRLPDPVGVELLEDNVLLLDRSEWRLDDGPWQPTTEILTIDNEARRMLGRPPRHGDIAQPWAEPARPHDHRVTVSFTIVVEHETGPVRLALEDASEATIAFDGRPVETVADGEWMDIAFTPVRLGTLEKGEHRLEVSWAFGGSGGLEACYLLGDFGVKVCGTRAVVTAPVRNLTWGDATRQGLAFYGGVIRYRVQTTLPEGDESCVSIAHARGALVDVHWPDGSVTPVFRAPWIARAPESVRGEVELTIDCYGTRINTFGQVHNVAKNYRWWGPKSWRTEGDDWAEEYQLKATGVLVAPRVLRTSDRAGA